MRGWRGVAAVVVAALLCAGAVFIWQSARPEVYEARALLALRPASPLGATEGRPENLIFLARTYVAQARTVPVIDDAVGRSGLALDRSEARERTSVSVSTNDATIEVRAMGPSPEDARALAQGMSASLRASLSRQQDAQRTERLRPINEQIEALEAELAELDAGAPRRVIMERQYEALVSERARVQVEPVDRIEVLSPAEPPDVPVSPRPARDAIIALVVAAAIGAEVLVLRRLYRRERANPAAHSGDAEA